MDRGAICQPTAPGELPMNSSVTITCIGFSARIDGLSRAEVEPRVLTSLLLITHQSSGNLWKQD